MKRKWIRKSLGLLSICTLILFTYHTSFSGGVLEETCDKKPNYTCMNDRSLLKAADSFYCLQKSPIFFVETSSAAHLNVRQACAIESASAHNPDMEVIVLTLSPKTQDALMKRLAAVPNIRMTRVEMRDLVCGTPLWHWYLEGEWKKSKYKESHLSDALRFFLMWKYGGIYLDLDVVVLDSLQHFKNAAVTEDWNRVASGILFFDKGHQLMRNCMFDFVDKYDYSNFVANGPGIITNNIKALCDSDKIGKISGSNCDVDILPPAAAFPIPYDKWSEYFLPSSLEALKLKFNSSHLVHVWNKYSKVATMTLGTNSLYELSMKQNCPLTFTHAESIGYA